MREKFEEVVVEVIALNEADVITRSGCLGEYEGEED